MDYYPTLTNLYSIVRLGVDKNLEDWVYLKFVWILSSRKLTENFRILCFAYRDHDREKVFYAYSAFIETSYSPFSTKRTMPSLFDGLKMMQKKKKVLFVAFEKPLIQSQPVYIFSGYASEHINYLIHRALWKR